MSRLTGDFLRVLSISAVMMIHASSVQEAEFMKNHVYFSQSFAGVFINQISRFCVPVFILLSGYGLSMKYASTDRSSINISFAADFYKKRFFKIGIPFFFWTVTLLILFRRFSFEGGTLENLYGNIKVLLEYLFVRGADYHFYFFTIILECYLLYPLLLKFRGPVLLGAILITQILFYYPVSVSEFLGIPYVKTPSSLFIHWMFYFYAGMLSADKKILDKIRSLPPALYMILSAIAFSYVLYEYIQRSLNEPDPGYYNHFNRLSVLLFSLSFWALFLRMDAYLNGFFNKIRAEKFILYSAGLSFGVYIYHTMILRLLNYTFFEGSLFLLFAVVAASFLFVALLNFLVRGNYVRVILGLPEKSA